MTADSLPTSDILLAAGFYVFGFSAIAGGLGVILAPRIFHSALFLVLALGSVAAIFVVLGADFLAAVQVLIYVGAIMVLILFGIMLTPQTATPPDLRGAAPAAGAIIAALLFAVAAPVLLYSSWPRSVPTPVDIPTTPLIADRLFNVYALPFEIASVLLLVAMIGAIVIARED